MEENDFDFDEPELIKNDLVKVPDKLEPRQLLFIDEYMKDKNGTQAAIRAGYSEKTAQEQSSRLLSKVIIKQEVARRTAIIQKTTDVTVITATQELYQLIQDIQNDEKLDRNAQLKALDMIYKLNGLYRDNTIVNIQNNLSEIKISIVKPDIKS